MQYDFIIVGGGIVGVSSALSLLSLRPGASLLLIEKEPRLAQHQTGRNSGVIHAGVYYQPGSLKARFCKEGAEATIRFCEEHSIRFERCGKLIVATESEEMPRLEALSERCLQNGIEVERIDRAELIRREPRIAGLSALFVPATGIVDFKGVVNAMADAVSAAGGQIRCGTKALGFREEQDHITVLTDRGDFMARKVVVCAGLMADRLARLCGLGGDFQIVPFRGEYYRLAGDKNDIVRHLIYPVPDPALPFLGVHLTRMIDGFVTLGPNAVLGLKREGYSAFPFHPGDVQEMLTFRGTWNVMRTHWAFGVREMRDSIFKRRYLERCRRYCPELQLRDLRPHPVGIRAQAVMKDGTLVHDFLIRRTARTIHVCNAPSPAATSAIPIGRHVATQAIAA